MYTLFIVMDILNFISWIKSHRNATKVNIVDSVLPIGLKDDKRDDGYLPGAIRLMDLKGMYDASSQTTGVVITYDEPKIYNTATSPGTGNITQDLTGAELAVVQKIYHQDTIDPTLPANWVLVGAGFYVPGVLNIINAEWCDNTRVEYWITQ